MKNIISIIILFLFWSCELAPEFDNPLDPDNPEYETPETTILGGPSEGEIVDESTVTFSWEGNEQAVVYSTNLNNLGWSNWTSNTDITFDYLDEGGYTFQVKCKYSTGDEDESPAEINFTVDAIQGQSLRIYPLLIETTVNQTQTVSVFMEEVENVMTTEFDITYDPLLVTLQNVTEGELITDFAGESVMIYEIIENDGYNSIQMNLGVALGDNPGLTGTGSVVDIEFLPVSIGSFNIEVNDLAFRDYNNLEIPVNQIVNGRFEVE